YQAWSHGQTERSSRTHTRLGSRRTPATRQGKTARQCGHRPTPPAAGQGTEPGWVVTADIDDLLTDRIPPPRVEWQAGCLPPELARFPHARLARCPLVPHDSFGQPVAEVGGRPEAELLRRPGRVQAAARLAVGLARVPGDAAAEAAQLTDQRGQ